jgi:multidrug resistance efflux pump
METDMSDTPDYDAAFEKYEQQIELLQVALAAERAKVEKLEKERDAFMAALSVRLDELSTAIAEVERLKRGDFTADEFQNLCHNNTEMEAAGNTAEEFCKGCETYQVKLFGKSPIASLRSKLDAAEALLRRIHGAYTDDARYAHRIIIDEIPEMFPPRKLEHHRSCRCDDCLAALSRQEGTP